MRASKLVETVSDCGVGVIDRIPHNYGVYECLSRSFLAIHDRASFSDVNDGANTACVATSSKLFGLFQNFPSGAVVALQQTFFSVRTNANRCVERLKDGGLIYSVPP